MTHTEIGTSVSILTAPKVNQSYDIARDLARDLLQGCYDDYIYFYNGSGTLDLNSTYDNFVLIRADSVTRNGEAFICENCLVQQIFVVSDTSESDFDFSGYELDLDASPVARFSGSGSYPATPTYYTAYYTYNRDTVTVTSFTDNVIYSSFSNCPKLIEGVQNYAYAAFIIAFIVIGFKLADRLFRRVY